MPLARLRRRCPIMRETLLPWFLTLAFIMGRISCVSGAKGSAAPAAPVGGRGGKTDPMDFLSSISGSYTHLVDEDLSVTLSYDLRDDSYMPLSFLTRWVVCATVARLATRNTSWLIVRLHSDWLHV